MESYQQKILTQILNCSDVSFNQWICRQWKQLISIWKTNVIRSSHQCGWKVTHSLGINQFFVLEKPRMRVEYFKKKWHLCFTRSRCVLDWYRLGWCFSAIHAQTCPREWYIQDVTRECLIYAMILFVNGCKWATWAKLTSPADFCCCTFFGVWCHLGEYFFAATLGRLTGNLQKKAKDGLGGGMFTPFFTMIGTPIMGKMSVADSLSAKWTLTMAIKKSGDRFRICGCLVPVPDWCKCGFPIFQQKTKWPCPTEISVCHWFLAFVDVHVYLTFAKTFPIWSWFQNAFQSSNSEDYSFHSQSLLESVGCVD